VAQIFFKFQNFEILKFLKKINIFWHCSSVVDGRDAFSQIPLSMVTVFILAT
jgi:hypothetical protein